MVADPDKNVPSREPVHELCEQLDLLRAVTSAHSDAMFVKNLAGVYLYCNEAASRFVGRSCSEIVGRTDAELFEPEAAERILVQDRRVAVTERRETEDHFITVAGKPCLFETSKMPYRNSIGEVVGGIGIAREVSVSREEIQSLRESEERYPLDWSCQTPDMEFRKRFAAKSLNPALPPKVPAKAPASD